MSWARCTAGHVHWGPHGAAGLLLAREGAALLQLRAGWAHQGGTWSVPGGAIERRETSVQAALREADEELGLSSDAVVVRGSRVALCGGWAYETVLGETIGEVTVHNRSETAGHAWVLASEVGGLPLHPAFRLAWEDGDAVLRSFVAGTAPDAG